MRYMRFLLLICALALLVSGMALANPRTPSRMAACGTITAVDTTASTVTITPPAPPAGSRFTPLPPVTFGVTADTKIELDRADVDITALVAGQWAEAMLTKAADGTWSALRVCATTPFVFGTMSAIDSATNILTVQPPSRCIRRPVPPVPFQITNTTTVDKNGPAAVADILTGDIIRVSYLEPADPAATAAAIKIEVLPFEFCGKVTAVDATAGTITVQGGKTTTTFNVDPNAKIIVSRKTATLADVVVGSKAELDYFQTATASLAVDICATPPRAPAQSRAHR